jgi:hypothetical protein
LRRGGWCDGIDAHALRREFDGHGAGHRSDRALCGGVAIAAGDAHQRDIRRHVDDRPAAGADDLRDGDAAAKERAEQIEPDDAPEFFYWRFDHGVVVRC